MNIFESEIHNHIIDALTEAGYDTWIVGGAVRDFILGKPCSDIDIATAATPEDVRRLFPHMAVQFVGETFGVSIVGGVEVATFRHDHNETGGAENCEVRYAKTIHEDLARRDFTVNAMAIRKQRSECGETTIEILDPFGGERDALDGVVRFVGNPIQRIYEDPNRIIRAARMAAKMNGRVSESSANAIHEYLSVEPVSGLIAPERIRIEILKAMELEKPSIFWNILYDFGIMDEYFPELADGYLMNGGPYHNETVWEHCMDAGDSVSSRFPLVRLAAYLHDIGKPVAWNGQNFSAHDKIGESVVKNRLRSLKFSSDEIRKISGLVRHHMREMDNVGPVGMRRNIRTLSESGVCIWDFWRIRIADHNANRKTTNLSFSDIKRLISAYESEAFRAGVASKLAHLAVNGRDLIELGIEQGPEIGAMLSRLLEEVTVHPEHNTREHLIKLVEEGM